MSRFFHPAVPGPRSNRRRAASTRGPARSVASSMTGKAKSLIMESFRTDDEKHARFSNKASNATWLMG